MREGLLGRSYHLHAADWLLDRAVIAPPKPDPGDQTWAAAQGSAAKDAAKKAAESVADLGKGIVQTGLGVGVMALLCLLSRDK